MRAEGRLAERQAALVAALVTGAGRFAGIDPARGGALSRILLAKRRKGLLRRYPELRHVLRDSPALFELYAVTHPVRERTDPRTDAARYLRWMRRRGALPRDRALTWLEVRLRIGRLLTPFPHRS